MNTKQTKIEKLISRNIKDDEGRTFYRDFFNKSKLTRKDLDALVDDFSNSGVTVFKIGNTVKFEGIDTHFVGHTRHFFDELMVHIKAKGLLSEMKDICAELDASCDFEVDIESDGNVLLYPTDVRKYKAWHAKNQKKLKLAKVKPYDGYGEKTLSVPHKNWEKYLESNHKVWLKKHAA